jgi:hypothetical protein
MDGWKDGRMEGWADDLHLKLLRNYTSVSEAHSPYFIFLQK